MVLKSFVYLILVTVHGLEGRSGWRGFMTRKGIAVMLRLMPSVLRKAGWDRSRDAQLVNVVALSFVRYYRKPHVALAHRIATDPGFPAYVRLKAEALLVLAGVGKSGKEREKLFADGRQAERRKTRIFMLAAEAYSSPERMADIREEALAVAGKDEELRAWHCVLFDHALEQ